MKKKQIPDIGSELPPACYGLPVSRKAVKKSKSGHNPRWTYNKFTRSASSETAREHRNGKRGTFERLAKNPDTNSKGQEP